jgi:methylated-DNA-[protein]-cysteine S-methyltransferase
VEVTRQRPAVRHRYEVAAWGVGELVVRDGVLIAHALPSRRRRLSPPPKGPKGGASTPEDTVSAEVSREDDAFVSDLCRRFAEHLSGAGVSYDDVVVDEDGLGGFQRELLAAARSIGWGNVVTYGGLAALAGRPRAARAAGAFCARNVLSLVVPCHRVVAAGRDEPYVLGPYGPGGARLKGRLLALEGTLL